MSFGEPKLKEREQRKGSLGLWLCFPSKEATGQVHNHKLCLLQFLHALPLHSSYPQIVTGCFHANKMQHNTVKYPAVIPLSVIRPCGVYEMYKVRVSSSCLYSTIFSDILFSISSAWQFPYKPHIFFWYLLSICMFSKPHLLWRCAFNLKDAFTPFWPKPTAEFVVAVFPGTNCYSQKDSPWKRPTHLCFASW